MDFTVILYALQYGKSNHFTILFLLTLLIISVVSQLERNYLSASQ